MGNGMGNCHQCFEGFGKPAKKALTILISNIGALLITYTIFWVPYYMYGIMRPKLYFDLETGAPKPRADDGLKTPFAAR